MDEFIYLDNSATAWPKPERVYRAMDEFFREAGVNPGRSGTDKALEAENMVFGTRKRLTEFFGGTEPNRLIFGYNATDVLNQVISGMLIQGDHVITTLLEHNSVLRPVYVKEIAGEISVDYVSFDSKGYVDPDDIKKRINKRTALVIVNHGSNVIGTVQPIAEIGRICREAEVPFVIDASQTAGIVPIDMKSMNVDVVAFTGHKCLMGPTGIGGLCVGEDVQIRTTRFGGTGVRSAVRTHLDEYPFRLEAGTVNLMGIAGLSAGLDFIEEKGMEKLHQQEMALYKKLRDGVADIPEVTTYCAGSAENHLPVISLNVKNWIAGDVGTLLDVEYGVATRTGLQCAPLVHEGIGTMEIKGTVRLSAGPFNTEEHIDIALKGLRDIADMRSNK
ncbi:MAG: aminotransferase class V-fold PLP-dependent enzyme [Planctomycetota bacterium]|jgi:cysteine desulfurase family protein